MNEPGKSPTVLSFKQPEFTTSLKAVLKIKDSTAKRFGVAAYYNNDYHYEIYVGSDESGKYVGFYKHIHDMGAELAHIPISKEDENLNLLVKIDTDREKYTFLMPLLIQRILMQKLPAMKSVQDLMPDSARRVHVQ